jgi:hypothetical protein
MAAVTLPNEQRLLRDNVSWQTCAVLLREFAERPAIRLTDGRGRLEIVTVSHEQVNDLPPRGPGARTGAGRTFLDRREAAMHGKTTSTRAPTRRPAWPSRSKSAGAP